MAKTKVVVDPVTRIEGHLRIEAQVDNGKVTDAWASSTQFRGIEMIMQGSRPARRLGLHAAHLRRLHRRSRRGLDAAPSRTRSASTFRRTRDTDSQPRARHADHAGPRDPLLPPARARLGGRGHGALKADPAADGEDRAVDLAVAEKSSTTYFRDVQDRLKTFVDTGQLGIFANGYWGHPAYKLPPEVEPARPWRTTSKRSTGSATSSASTRFSAARTRTRTSSSAAWRRRHQPRCTATINAERPSRVEEHDPQRAATSSSRCTSPTCSPSPPSTRTGRRSAAASATIWPTASIPTTDVRDTGKLYLPARRSSGTKTSARSQRYDQEKVSEYVHTAWYEYGGGDAKAACTRRRARRSPNYTGPQPPWTLPRRRAPSTAG